jgi:cell division protein FtsQ
MSPSRPPAPRPAPGRSGTPAARAARPGGATTEREVCAPAVPVAVRPQPGPTVPPPAPRAGTPATATAATATTATATTATTTRTTYEVRRFRGPVRPAVVSSRSAERFAERARAARNLARRQIALVAGGVAALVGLGYLVLFSPVFALDPAKATVTGAGTVVAVDQVAAVVTRHDGTPLPRLDVGRLRAEVLQVPGVRDATVSRHWPRGLTIALVSREPVAAVPEQQAPQGAAKAGYALLDQDGVQVGRTEPAPAGLPVVTVPVDDPRTLQAVLSVVRQLPADLASQVGGVSARTQDTISMTLRDGVTVDWGSADETALKAAVLKALRASPAAAGVHTIDVSAPRMPITK